MDFSYPREMEQFRKELRAWLTAAVIQIFGGIGYTWEHDAHLYLKRLLSWNAFLGGPDRYLEELGAQFARAALR